VVTGRPIPDAWANSRVVDGPLAQWIAATCVERDVVVIGSTSVVDELAAARLVDEYRLLTFPLAVGAGRRLFTDAVDLELASAEPVGPGVLTVHRVVR
jgi:dihydrofolate reductase